MINYQYLNTHRDLFPAAVGISYTQFAVLLAKFTSSLRKAENTKAWSKPRIRIPGGGRKARLTSDTQKLFFILFYYKSYPTFRLAQTLFLFDKRNIQLWVRFLELVLWNTLGYQLELPIVKAKTLHGLFSVCPVLKGFITDATERLIRRPKDSVNQEFYYSGKKQRHTVKNQLLVSPRTKRILAVSDMYEGKRHDKRIFEEDPLFLKIPPKAVGLGDTAYQGIHHPFLSMITPIKKPPGGELSDDMRQNNKSISKIRVGAEHPIAYLKHFNILSHTFRSRIKYAQLPFQNISAIYNFTRNYT